MAGNESGSALNATAVAASPGITISASAAGQIARLLQQEEDGAMLRIAVSGGGCSGFQYGFSFDTDRTDEDKVFERNGARVVIDEISLELLNGAEIDYVEDLSGSTFAIRNPNASSSCGCGSSFAV